MSSSISPIYKLSNDNLVNIFSFLDLDERARIASVSRTWNTMIKDPLVMLWAAPTLEDIMTLAPYSGGTLDLEPYKRDNTDIMYIHRHQVVTYFKYFINQTGQNQQVKFIVHVPYQRTAIHISLSHGNPLNSNIRPDLVQQVVVIPEPEEEPAALNVRSPRSYSSSKKLNRLCLRELVHSVFGFPCGTSRDYEASIVKETSEPTPFARPLRDKLQEIGQARLNAIEEQQSRRINRQLIGLSVIIAIAAVVFKIATTFARSDS